jgi:hypothetical protein
LAGALDDLAKLHKERKLAGGAPPSPTSEYVIRLKRAPISVVSLAT